MMKRTVFISIVIALFLWSCTEKQGMSDYGQAKYTINLDSIESTKTPLKLSTIFKSIRTIILEDHEYAVLGQINEIQVFDNNIFVLDKRKAKKLFVYDMNGKYLREIGSQGQGPGEYSYYLSDFCIDTLKRQIYLLDPPRVHVYNWEGKHIKSIQIKTNEFGCQYITFCNNRLYIAITSWSSSNPGNLILELNPETGEQKEYLDANVYNCGWNGDEFTPSNFFIDKLGGTPKFKALYMNSFMKIDKDSIYPYLTVTHKEWVRKSDILSQEKLRELDKIQMNIIDEKRRVFIRRHNYVETNRYICFQDMPPILIDKQTGEAKRYSYLENDLKNKENVPSTPPYIAFYNSNKAYEYLEEECTNLFVEHLKTGKLVDDLDKKDELLKIKDEYFILFEYEFR
ncbi:MAG: 6-bladed beta-propeller [Prevotellaceae bacterium]|jgi:hypothetical protein|nr:6-bladed beta-propeller [Prevotellaceae bacterium]